MKLLNILPLLYLTLQINAKLRVVCHLAFINWEAILITWNNIKKNSLRSLFYLTTKNILQYCSTRTINGFLMVKHILCTSNNNLKGPKIVLQNKYKLCFFDNIIVQLT